MAEPISIQQLKNASEDAISLGEAVNGDENSVVTTRLGETYPSLSNALNQIDSKLDSADTQVKQGITNLFEKGGLPATPFATKALMTASALVDGDYAMVTDDTVNNGLYVKTAGAWVKSAYDPFGYIDSELSVLDAAKPVEPVVGAYLKLDSTGKIYREPIATVDTYIVNVKEGDLFTVYGRALSAVKNVYITDATGTVIEEVGSYSANTLQRVEIPSGGVKLYVNNLRSNTAFKFYRETQITSYLSERIQETSDKLAPLTSTISDSWFDKYPPVSQTIVNTGTAIKVSFSRNPRITNSKGEAAWLFPEDSTDFTLPDIPSYSFLYVTNLGINNYTATKYLAADDIKVASYLSNIDFSNKNATIVVLHTGGVNPNTFGAVGNRYAEDAVDKVKSIDTRLTTTEGEVRALNNSWFDRVPAVNQTILNTGTAIKVSFSRNPRITNSKGEAAYLFPSDTTDFTLPDIPSYSFLYVTNLGVNNYTATKYLAAGDIKVASYLSNINFNNKNATIIALHTGGFNPHIFGAVGNRYAEDAVDKVKSIDTRLTTTEGKVNAINIPTGVTTSFPEKPNYQGVLKEKCPNFYENYKLKDKDIVVCMSGSSMTQGNLYATNRPDGTTRPPLLHTNDYASYIYDKLEVQWDKQQYRRYDHADLTYVGGGWVVTNNLKVGDVSVWDDMGERHNGLTKTTTDASATVSTAIPKGAYQFNFIHRTDSNGATAVVSITEGVGMVEVYDGAAWVEAHNYTFSMLEPAATETKGNTIYQKRLKMRCKNRYIEGGIDSRGAAKTITISNTSSTGGNFNVVGFEWSPREFMLTFINAARGGGQWGMVAGNNLENFQDGDIWIHKPDLVLMEVTGINWGASADIYGDYRSYINIARRTYFNEFNDSPNSYAEKSLLAGNETMFYASSVSAAAAYDWIFDTESGDQLFGTITKPERYGAAGVPEDTSRLGGVTNGFDNMYAIDHYMQSKGVFYAQSTAAFKEVAEKYYDGFYFAMRPSGKSGLTLSSDGTHYNDNGHALWAHMITSVFDNI